MAANKECVIAILDVRASADEEFKRKSIKCVAEMFKEKICAAKKDYVSIVLVGTERTFNDVNQINHDDYQNIVQYPQIQICTWQLLMNYYKFVNEEASNEGDWLDAVVVAMELIKTNQDVLKFQRSRILLFYDFNSQESNYDAYDVITTQLMKMDINLVVISHNIQYIDNSDNNNEPQAIFGGGKKDKYQLENEKYALSLVSNCNAKLCNFEEALRTMLKTVNRRPWSWQNRLRIGTKINIAISGIIAIKDESNIKLKKCYGEAEELVSRERKCFVKGLEFEPLEIDLIDGYMLGATPIPYDETLRDEEVQHPPGLNFLGFVPRHTIPDQHFCGDSMYLVVHQKGMTASAKQLDALVRALLKTKMAILCYKIFSAKFNDPKLVVLLPNELDEDKPSTLVMIELAYNVQHHYWDFPSIRTKKTECTPAQLESIDKLIDSMDLMLRDEDIPRETFKKDLLPFDTLPHIYEQNVMDILERKILCNAGEDDDRFLEMLADKNFVEIFWKVPELIERESKKASNNVKKLFQLRVNEQPTKAKAADAKSEQNNNDNYKDAATTAPLSIQSVGEKTPADDFEKLLKHNVITLQDRTTRDRKFHVYAAQMRNVVMTLLKQTEPLQEEAINEALKVYRKSSYDFNAIVEYNTWIKEVKSLVIKQKLFKFWREHVVQNELGICIVGIPSLHEKIESEEFYLIPDENASESDSQDDEMTDAAVDFLLARL